MKIRAQFALVFNLDKCIGCHTCSVTCKNVWTNRKGRVRLVQQRRVQARHRLPQGMGKTRRSGRAAGPRLTASWNSRPGPPEEDHPDLRQPQPAADRRLLRTLHLRSRPPAERALPSGADGSPDFPHHRREDGQDHLGSELGRRSGRRVPQSRPGPELLQHGEGDVQGVPEHLPSLPAAHLQPLHQPGLRRLLPLGRHAKREGGRHRPGRPGPLPRLAHVHLGLSLQEGLLQLGVVQGREVHRLLPRVESGLPTICSRSCVGRIRYNGIILYDADKVLDAASTDNDQGSLQGPPRHVRRSLRPEGDRPGQGRRHFPSRGSRRRKVAHLQDGRRLEDRLPAPPEFRTLPMVWYVPPLSPVQSQIDQKKLPTESDGCIPKAEAMRLPVKVPGQPDDGGQGRSTSFRRSTA